MWFYQLLYIVGSISFLSSLFLMTKNIFKDSDDAEGIALALMVVSIDLLILGTLVFVWIDIF